MHETESEDFNYADYSCEELATLAGQISYGQFKIDFHEKVLRQIMTQRPDDELLLNTFKLQFIDALTMSGQMYRIPQLFRDVDAYREAQWQSELSPEFLYSFGWQYRNYIDALCNDPSVSATELHTALAGMREFYINQNDDMKSYYLRAYYVHKELGEEALAAELRELWLQAPHSEFSDCAGCDPTHVVWMHAAIGDWQQAVAVGEQALNDPAVNCGAQPENLELALLEPWLRTGDFDAADSGNSEALLRNSEDPMYLEHFPAHFRFFTLAGTTQPKKLMVGLDLFSAFAKDYCKAESARVLMNLCSSSALLLSHAQVVLGRRLPKRLATTLPGEELLWVSAPTITNPTPQQAQQWCEKVALDLAAQFDAREGLRYPHTIKQVQREIYKTTPPSGVPKAGLWEMLHDEVQREVLKNRSAKRALLRILFRSLPVSIIDLFRYKVKTSKATDTTPSRS